MKKNDMKKSDTKFYLAILLDQLQYAVATHRGKTTITQADLRILSAALSQLPDEKRSDTYTVIFTHGGEETTRWTGYASWKDAWAAIHDADMIIPLSWSWDIIVE